VQIYFDYLHVNQILEGTVVFARLGFTHQPMTQLPRQKRQLLVWPEKKWLFQQWLTDPDPDLCTGDPDLTQA